jgi:hypothetical protein
VTDPYEQIALHLPNEVAIGGALITMVEPDPGHEHAYNRWYEDDHFYSGAMHGPWTFAGKRWVAPRALRNRRAEVASNLVDPPDAGCYISLYWLTAGHEDDNARWSYTAMGEALMPHGRGFTARRHTYTAFHQYRFGLVRDSGPLKPHLALDANFPGLLVEVIDAPSPEAFGDMQDWLRTKHLPQHLSGSAAAMVLAFTPRPFSQGRIDQPGTPPVEEPQGVGRQLCLLWFLDRDPRGIADDDLRKHHAGIAEHPLTELRFSGAFLPTMVGTDAYVDELR